MSANEPAVAPAATGAHDTPPRGRGILFWMVRYLPAEIAGTVAMLVAGLAASAVTGDAALIAVAALAGEIVGFYVVLGATVAWEQSRHGARGRRLAVLTLLLLVAEFGVAELFDTFLVRPAALVAGVLVLTDPVWGLLAGKIVADIVFYVLAASAFTLTDKAGLRRRASAERTP